MFSTNEIYRKSLDTFSKGIDWKQLNHKRILIVGAGGLIGSYLIDLIMHVNQRDNLDIKVVANGRNKQKLTSRFSEYMNDDRFSYVLADVNDGFNVNEDVDYILHLASNTHPLAYSEHPVETLMTNVVGTYNLLNYARNHVQERFIFASSVEIYGQAMNEESFSEGDYGYIDCNTSRACYNEGKRAGESLCQAFIKQYGIDVVIPRLCRVYGPTMKLDDSKALSQFIKKALAHEDIVLKSAGTQYFSYLYVGDVVNALVYLMLKGKCGEAYNVADYGSNIRLKDLAGHIADAAGRKVIFDLPDAKEAAGYSKANVAILNSQKINQLGWKAQYDINTGIQETVNILGQAVK